MSNEFRTDDTNRTDAFPGMPGVTPEQIRADFEERMASAWLNPHPAHGLVRGEPTRGEVVAP